MRMQYRRSKFAAPREMTSATLAKKLPGDGAVAFPMGHYHSKERARKDATRFRLWVDLGFPSAAALPAAELDAEFAEPGEDPVSMRLALDRERARRRREEGHGLG